MLLEMAYEHRVPVRWSDEEDQILRAEGKCKLKKPRFSMADQSNCSIPYRRQGLEPNSDWPSGKVE